MRVRHLKSVPDEKVAVLNDFRKQPRPGAYERYVSKFVERVHIDNAAKTIADELESLAVTALKQGWHEAAESFETARGLVEDGKDAL